MGGSFSVEGETHSGLFIFVWRWPHYLMEMHHGHVLHPSRVVKLFAALSLRHWSLAARLSPPSTFFVSFTHSRSPAPNSPSPELRSSSCIMHINCRGQMECVFWDNEWSDGTWTPPDCGVSALVIKRQGRRGRRMLAASFSAVWMSQKAMSKCSRLNPSPSPAPSPQQSLCHFCLHPSRESPWFTHRSRVHVRHLQTQSVTEWQPYRKLCVIIQYHMPLKANIYCIRLVVIEWLWCLSPPWQSQASPLCLPEIYSSVVSFSPSCSSSKLKTRVNVTPLSSSTLLL